MTKILRFLYKRRLLKIGIFVFFLFFFFSKTSFAANFSTNYSVTYKVNENETTNVTLNVDLKNNTSEFYVSSYSVQTGFSDISNISIKDSGGAIVYQMQKNDKGTLLTFSFNKNVVGINNIQSFVINFDTKEIASKFGSIWEVNIPGISNQSTFSQFNVSVVTPASFGEPSIIKPAVKNLSSVGRTLKFSKDDLGEGGIAISYGDYQVYNFDLKYNIFNKEVFPVSTEIALPSNNNYQNIEISDIDPKPLDVTMDTDGNWLAKYHLNGGEKVTVKVRGKAQISHKPNPENLSDSDKAIYLQQDSYWETKSKDIVNLANELKTPRKIYDYVVNNLSYDQNRVRDTQVRAGALGVLSNKKSAVCLEFTDLFIALARAAGIPAREVEGYANTTNTASRPLSLFQDVLHSWPEYYDFDKKAWIMVDPTWENTTGGIDYFNVFDFDHFAFVIKGLSSTYPVPAGGYKFPKNDTQDVQVTVGSSFFLDSASLTATSEFKNNYLSGLPITGNFLITNSSGTISQPQTIQILSDSLSPNVQNFKIGMIPPYGHKLIKVSFNSVFFLTNKDYVIKIKVNQNTIENTITLLPFYRSVMFYFVFGGIIIGITILIIFISARRSRRISVPKR